MAFAWTFLACAAAIAALTWYILQRKRSHWQRQNVEIISIWDFIRRVRRRSCAFVFHDYFQEMRKAQQAFRALEVPFFSTVIVQDMESLKDILIRQFENFADRSLYSNPRDVLSAGISRIEYKKWKPIRQMLSPSFTPAKIKKFFPTVVEKSQRLVKVLEEQCCAARQELEVEIYDTCARFTTDTITQILYGLESNCLQQERSEFREYGDRSFYELGNPWKNMLGFRFPKLMRFLNVRVFGKQCNEFFIRIFKESLQYRQKNNIQRHDIMDILLNLQKESIKIGEFPQTLEMLVGHSYSFFLGGFETSSCTMAYGLYELAKNQNIQNKVRKEIQEVLTKYDQEFTYESLKDMVYLNQIVMETLRKYPVIPFVPRNCRRTSNVRTRNGTVTIPCGTTVIMSYYGVHHNPDIYPDPEEFRPERFTHEEIAKRPACSFMAFGEGPKSCLGELFGKMQISLGLAMLLSQFRFSLCDKSPEKLIFDPQNLLLLFVKDGIKLNIETLK